MTSRRLSLHGLFAVLLALAAQLGIGASVPRADPIAVAAAAICHTDGNAGGAPGAPAPAHPLDCLACPLCIALHAPATALIALGTTLAPPAAMVVLRSELPPPSTAPPAPRRPPSQPRAPPTSS